MEFDQSVDGFGAEKTTARLLAVAVLLGGSLLVGAPQASALGIVRHGCINGNYWFVTDNGNGSYGWGVIYGDDVHC